MSAAPDTATIMVGSGVDGEPVTLAAASLYEHGLVIGATGSGKTTTIVTLVDGWLRSGGGLVVIDMKGDPLFAETLARLAGSGGLACDAWSLRGRRAAWRPLAGRAPADAAEMVLALAAARDGRGAVYRDAARGFLQLAFACWREAGAAPGFEEVQWVLSLPNRLEQVADRCGEPAREAVAALLDALARDRTALDGVRTMAHRVGALAGPGGALSRLGEPRDADGLIDPRRVLREGGVAVWSVAAGAARQGAAEAGTLALLDVVAAAVDDPTRSSAPGCLLVVDEFSTLTGGGHGEEVIDPLARLRGLRVGTLLATQALGDLRSVAPEFAARVLSTVGLVVSHRVAVEADAREVAALGGTELVTRRTRTYRQQPVGVFASRELRVGATEREEEVFVTHPDALRRLAPGEAVAFRRGRGVAVRVGAPAASVGSGPVVTGVAAARRRWRDWLVVAAGLLVGVLVSVGAWRAAGSAAAGVPVETAKTRLLAAGATRIGDPATLSAVADTATAPTSPITALLAPATLVAGYAAPPRVAAVTVALFARANRVVALVVENPALTLSGWRLVGWSGLRGDHCLVAEPLAAWLRRVGVACR